MSNTQGNMTSTNDEKHEFAAVHDDDSLNVCGIAVDDSDICGQPRSAAIHGVVSEAEHLALHNCARCSLLSGSVRAEGDLCSLCSGYVADQQRAATEPPAATEAKEETCEWTRLRSGFYNPTCINNKTRLRTIAEDEKFCSFCGKMISHER